MLNIYMYVYKTVILLEFEEEKWIDDKIDNITVHGYLKSKLEMENLSEPSGVSLILLILRIFTSLIVFFFFLFSCRTIWCGVIDIADFSFNHFQPVHLYHIFHLNIYIH